MKTSILIYVGAIAAFVAALPIGYWMMKMIPLRWAALTGKISEDKYEIFARPFALNLIEQSSIPLAIAVLATVIHSWKRGI